MNTSELYTELIKFLDANDEQGAKDFLVEHLNDFPEDIKEKIVFYFFSEAVEKESLMEQLKKDGLEMLKQLDSQEQNLTDQKKIEGIRKDILG